MIAAFVLGVQVGWQLCSMIEMLYREYIIFVDGLFTERSPAVTQAGQHRPAAQ